MVGEPNQVVECESALDWVTLSSPVELEAGLRFDVVSRDMARRHRSYGEPPKELRAGAYTGEKIGKWSFLRRAYDGHRIVTVEGSDAEAALQEMHESEAEYRVTRIDCQHTARYKKPQKEYGQQLAETIRAHWAEKARLRRVPLATFSNSLADTGITIGSRASAIYCRIYDWEAKHLGETSHKLWRYEVEAKEEAAKQLAAGWLNASRKSQFCSDIVDTRLRKYGIRVDMKGDRNQYPLAGTKGRGTVEQRLKHLRKAVCPFLGKLVDEIGEEAFLQILREQSVIR